MLQIDSGSFVFFDSGPGGGEYRGELIAHNKIKRVIYILINCFIPRAMRNDDEEEEENPILSPRKFFFFVRVRRKFSAHGESLIKHDTTLFRLFAGVVNVSESD